MGRKIFRCCLVLSSLFIGHSKESHSGALATFDFKTFKTLSNVLSTAGESLQELKTLSGEMMEMNSVLGSRLDPGFLQKVMKVGNLSGDFSFLLSSLTGQGGDSLMQLNHMNVQHGGKKDFSNYIYAKNYFQQKFFSDRSITTPTQLSQLRDQKLEAVQVSTVDSLAIATQQKKTLRDDHYQLTQIKVQAEQNPTLQYQTNMQTRLLEHIAHQLDKLILLQSQQLELMATYMAQAQPTVFKKMSSPQLKAGK
ncbi:hypothetical protein IM40_11230 (plasmid) [Candidatus Paracaedimonas acanthamoebae]|nr:hypothetical protein IM40_09240 [Candidatus Paracaedimonas acanthamoebae]AIL13902.1 hypothetical protein IM40_11230 [Candidatus Paracaedimonas acanthamoebae]